MRRDALGAAAGRNPALEADLARGVPLKEALARRALPDLYRQMVEMGARSNDLPGVLTLLADHYHRANALWTRLKGLMVYPLLVILVSLGLTVLISLNFSRFMTQFCEQDRLPSAVLHVSQVIWVPPIVLALAAAARVGGGFHPELARAPALASARLPRSQSRPARLGHEP